MLAEFASARDAVRCAIDTQAAMADRESLSPTDRQIMHRVGIDLGDVVFEEGRYMARLILARASSSCRENNHSLVLTGTPALDQFLEEATNFIATHDC